MVFYTVSGIILAATLGMLYMYWKEITGPTANSFAWLVASIAVVSSIGLIVITKKLLVGKHEHRSDELDPVVNKFTINADKQNIKLLAGDLDFWGAVARWIRMRSMNVCESKTLKRFRFCVLAR